MFERNYDKLAVAADQNVKERDFWLNKLAGDLSKSRFPVERMGRIAGEPVMKAVKRSFTGDLFSKLMQLSKGSDVKLHMIMTAGLAVLLKKYTGNPDVIIAAPIYKQDVDIEFINTVLVLRTRVEEGTTFKEMLLQVRQTMVEAVENQNYPIEVLVEQLGMSYKPGGYDCPLFDVVILHENIHDRKYIDYISYNMLFSSRGAGDHIEAVLEYNSRLYEEAAVERISDHYLGLWDSVLANVDKRVSDIDILSEEEKGRILYDFNGTGADYSQEKTVHELFEQQVEKTPGKIVVVGNGSITYEELNRKSNHLARLLRARGVRPDRIAGLMMERSIEMITGILGILKAGGVYLPIDAAYPAGRIRYMLTESDTGILLTASADALPENLEYAGEVIDLTSADIYQGDAPNPGKINELEDAAYIIYTSGSTGKPKGVLVEHRNMLAYLHAFYGEFDITERDTALQQASCSFDAFVEEVYPVMLKGGKVVIAPGKVVMEPAALTDFLLKHDITFISVSPLVLNEIDKIPYPTGIRIYISGGDVLKKEYVNNLLNKKAGVVYNTYGPTETTVCATYHCCSGKDGAYPPIGKPIANYRAYILGTYGELLPIGVPGELCITGAGVTRGYLNRPELTAEKFDQDLWDYQDYRDEKKENYQKFFGGSRGAILQKSPPGLLYKTGDLARWLADGHIEFLGRVDQQVKIRGYRIELGEIENRLLAIEGIKDAVVLAKGSEGGDYEYLCAYLVSEEELVVPGLKKHLAEDLPDYMIPSYFMRLEKIPLTPHGKLNRKALPEPEITRGKEYIAPRNEVEEKLAEIWAEVLEVDKDVIGIDSDFFDLGGYSWKATVLISRVHQQLNVKLPFTEVFSAPTIRDMAGYIEKAGEDAFVSIEPVEEKEYYALSPAQKRLYILHNMEPGSTAYNLPQGVPVRVGMGIDKEKLAAAFKILIARHESLRTSFLTVGDEPVQRIHKPGEVALTVEYYEAGDELEVKRINRDFPRTFDLSRAPLMRVGLVKIASPLQQKLLLDMHHIITDGVSQELLTGELTALYIGQELPSLRLRYKDYSEWVNSEEQKTLVKKQEDYWLRIFPDELPVLALPTDYPRPLIQSFAGNNVRFMLSEEDSRMLKTLAKETGTTLFLSVLSVFYVLLARLSGQEDIIVGTPVAARRHIELERIVGMFVNTLALRHYPSGGKTVKAFLNEVRERTLAAFENQEYQFEDLVEKVSVRRDTGRNPIFDVMFSFFNPEEYAGEIPEIDENSPYKHRKSISKFDMNLTGIDPGEDKPLFFDLRYCSKLFKPGTIERIITYFKQILHALSLDDADQRIRDVEIITGAERQQILYEFNETAADYPRDKTIHELFERQVEKTPDCVAVIGSWQGGAPPADKGAVGKKDEMHITYGVLNEKIDQLAHSLRDKGVLPDSIIGIMMERSIEMIAGILGILKGGGAYLPIDPEYPQERIDYMLKDSGAKLLVTTNNLEAPDFPFLPATGHRQPATSLAYIIYTSGSTGKPRGVMVHHQAVVNILFGLNKRYPFGEHDVYLLKTAVMFDVSVTELFGWFMGAEGGRLAIPERGAEKSPQGILDTVYRHRVTHLNFVPSMFNAFVEILDNRDIYKLAYLRYIFLAGEKLWAEPVKAFQGSDTNVLLENLYGPTEAAVYASGYSLSDWNGKDDIPIGKPLDNIELYILDRQGNLVPLGVPGELYISGDGLARGYLNNPELTAERFVDCSFYRSYRSYRTYIFYKTGDLARWLPEGDIEFLGRLDTQVKIRGFRIELGEIEARLLKRAAVKEAVVLAKEDRSGEKYLCAYIVLNKGLDELVLRDILSRELPAYMIPSYFVTLEAIPLTPNGKVDRKALPEPTFKAGKDFAAPQDEIQRKLLEIWSGVLGIEGDIGIDSNFFEQGGHSLKAMILAARIHKQMAVKVPLTQIFLAPTIRKLSAYIKGAGYNRYASIEPAEKKEYYALSPAQKRLYILQQMEPDNIVYNLPQVIPLVEDVDIRRLEPVFKKLITRHESLRTSFEMIDDVPVQKIHEPDEVEFAIEYFDLTTKGHHFVRAFDLSKAPLLRVASIKIEDGRHLLQLDIHHIITDGTSQSILADEFLTLYTGDELPPLRLQYKDYSEWQSSEEQQYVIKDQETYWLNMYAGELPVLNLPFDYPRPLIQSFEGASVSFMLTEVETQTLKTLAQKAGSTFFMTILAIWEVLLLKLSGQEDIIVGTPIAGRRHADLERIIGMFVNTLALRNYPSQDKTFSEFLQEVRVNTLAAFENQEYQFEDLVEKAAVPRDAGRSPLFDVMFNMQNRADFTGYISKSEEWKDSRPFKHRKGISKFDLTLTAVDMGKHLRFSLEYCTKLFKTSTIERFIGYFQKICNLLSENAYQKIGDIEIITEVEKQQVLYEFNETAADYPRDKTIHELFDRQVEKTPEKIALVGNVSVTYAELNRKSNRLAHVLKEKGVLADNIIGIMVERSIEMIVGILGILKAGGAYLPIDPKHPQERINYMLKDCGAKLLVTTNNLEAPDFPLLPAAGHRLPATSLAYIIYTSGTTGWPKGVLIQHQGVVNMVWCHRKVFGENSSSRISQAASVVFDAMAFEVWPCLLAGACLCIADDETRVHPRLLIEWLIRHQITISFQSTLMALQLLEEQWPVTGTSLKALRTAGDRLTRYLIRPYPFRFYNLYGPTEDTIWTTWTEVPVIANPPEQISPPSIGKPTANKQVYILGPDLKLQPVGVIGELCISGDGLARGYLNNPELTAERFDQDLWDYQDYQDEKKKKNYQKFFGGDCIPGRSRGAILQKSPPGRRRLYRTGDLARWLPEGNIEFIGRIDQQVKIRGFRIEPGEIESRLSTHDEIKEAIVIAREDRQRIHQYLCAYFVPVHDKELSPEDLREYLSGRLPVYMIPSYFVRVERIPLTPSGKVDRKALPEPKFKAGKDYAAPRDEIERRLLETWSEVLGIEGDIGIDDNFFALGGHSLRATILMTRIRREFQINVPLVEIFNRSTIRLLAGYIKSRGKDFDKNIHICGGNNDNPVLLKKGRNTGRHLFFIHDGSGEVEGYIEFCNRLEPEENCWGIRSEAGRFDDYAPRNLTIEDIAKKYIEKIKKIQAYGPYRVVGWSLGGTIAYETVGQLEQKNETVEFLSLIDAAAPNKNKNKDLFLSEFTHEYELNWIKDRFPGTANDFYKKIRDASGLEQMWHFIVDYLETNHADAGIIRRIINKYEGLAIPGYEHLSIGELTRYLNIIRSFDRARTFYHPTGKLHTPVHYFKASRTRGIKPENWNDYTHQPIKCYEIAGDHYSILRLPDVLDFAAQFNRLITYNT